MKLLCRRCEFLMPNQLTGLLNNWSWTQARPVQVSERGSTAGGGELINRNAGKKSGRGRSSNSNTLIQTKCLTVSPGLEPLPLGHKSSVLESTAVDVASMGKAIGYPDLTLAWPPWGGLSMSSLAFSLPICPTRPISGF